MFLFLLFTSNNAYNFGLNSCVCNIVFYLHRSDVVVLLTHLLWSFNDSLQDTLLSIYLLFYIFLRLLHFCVISSSLPYIIWVTITYYIVITSCPVWYLLKYYFFVVFFYTQSTIKKEVHTVSHIKALNYFWQKYTNRSYIVTKLLQLTRKELIMLMWYTLMTFRTIKKFKVQIVSFFKEKKYHDYKQYLFGSFYN